MHICFVTTPINYDRYPCGSSALLIAIAKSQGFRTSLVDIRFAKNMDISLIVAKIQEHNPDIVAFCSILGGFFLDQVHIISSYFTDKIRIAGGPTFSSAMMPSFPLYDVFDVIFEGLSESAFLDWIKTGCPLDQKIIHGRGDFLPIVPDYFLHLQQNPYPYRRLCGRYVITTEFSRGCRNKCDFCGSVACYYKSFIRKDIDFFKHEVKSYASNFGGLFIASSLINHSLEDLEILCDVFESVNMLWGGMLQVMDIPDKLLDRMIKCGFRYTFIGIESFSESVCAKIGKHGQTGDKVKLIKNLFIRGVFTSMALIVADEPYQTSDEFASDLHTFTQVAPYVCNPAFHPLGFSPESSLFEKSKGLELILKASHDGSIYDGSVKKADISFIEYYYMHSYKGRLSQVEERRDLLLRLARLAGCYSFPMDDFFW